MPAFKIAPDIEREVERLYRQGMGLVGIAEQLGVGSRIVERILR